MHVLLQGIMKALASVLHTDTPKLQDTHTKRAQLVLAWDQALWWGKRAHNGVTTITKQQTKLNHNMDEDKITD